MVTGCQVLDVDISCGEQGQAVEMGVGANLVCGVWASGRKGFPFLHGERGAPLSMPVTSHTHLIFLLAAFKGEPAVASGPSQAYSHKREQAHWPLTFQMESIHPGANVAIQSARDEGAAL